MSELAKNILIVEDEHPLAEALEVMLSAAGFATTVARDGQVALDILKNNGFDLVILDLIMPRVNGFEVLEQLQKWEKVPKIIVLTNLSRTEDIERVKKLGVSDYFVKADTPLMTIVEQVGIRLGQEPRVAGS